MALSLGCTFVARAFVGDKEKLKEIIKRGISHKGYSLIDIFQPCVTFNKVNTYGYYKENTYYLDKDHDEKNLMAAMSIALKTDNKIPLGVIYDNPKNDFHDFNEHIGNGLQIENYDLEKVKKIIHKKFKY